MPKITLCAARINAGLTQAAAAELLKVAITTLRNWELGNSFPKQPQIESLCNLYGVTYDQINFNVKQ